MPKKPISQPCPGVINLLNVPVWLTTALVVFDAFVFTAAKSLAFSSYFFLRAYVIPNPAYDIYAYAPHPTLHFVLGLVVISVLWGRGLYTRRIPWWSQVRTLAHLTLFAFIVHGFLSFSLKIYDSRLFIIFYWIIVFHGLVLFKAILFKIVQKKCTSWNIPTVVVSDVATAEDILFAFSSDISTGFKVHTILIRRSSNEESEFDLSGIPPRFSNIKICYGVEGIEDYIKENPNNFYIISLDAFRDRARENILKVFCETKAPYSIVPSLSRANLYQMEPKYFFGHDVVILHIRSANSGFLDYSIPMLAKRMMDVTVSGGLLLFVGPLIFILGALLKIEGQGGSIFYGGKRIGKGGRLFNCWKLRSMEPNSDHLLTAYLDSNPQLKSDWEKFRKLPKDPRITTNTARLIRKLSLDELPQLWNIFVGDMSLVGPRPILEDEVHYFDESTMADYISVRPGLTGLWQVSGRNKTSFKRRVYWDSWYVRNWSFWGDLIILIKTPIVLITRKGAS